VLDRFITFTISGLVHSQLVLKVEFWTQGAALNSLLIITLGFIVYIVASKLGLIGRKKREFEISSFMVKLVKYLSVDRIYCDIAILVNKLCKKFDSVYPRDLNVRLSWVILTLIALFITFFFAIA